jgi:radical SAM superfamily enzyme YgiQ (UPF0313 family)
MRILLVYPNSNVEIIGWGDLGAIAEPLALEYIGAAAKDEGHDVQILDLRLTPDHLVPTLFAYQPDVIGVTGYSMHVLRMLEICALAKQILPNITTVVGGHHATLLPVDFHEPQVDYVVVGEGTLPFREVLAQVDGKVDGPIASVWSNTPSGFRSGGEALPFDIDAIPPPDRSLTAESRHRYFIDWMNPIALLRTTVGCPFRCSFCSLWRIMDGKYFRRDVERVVEEMGTVPERYIFLVDDEPFVSTRRMWALADAIDRAGLDKEFFSYCRLDSFLRDGELMRRWREIGLRRVFFGIETIFEDELVDYNKKVKYHQIVDGLQAAKDIGVAAMCNFIISPSYTEERFDEVTQFIIDHGVEYPTFTVLTPIPGTEWGSNFDNVTTLQANGRPNWEYYDLQHPVTETAMPHDEFVRSYKALQRVFAKHYLDAGHPMYEELKARQMIPAGSLEVPSAAREVTHAARGL